MAKTRITAGQAALLADYLLPLPDDAPAPELAWLAPDWDGVYAPPPELPPDDAPELPQDTPESAPDALGGAGNGKGTGRPPPPSKGPAPRKG